MTLEDETGTINLVLWQRVWERFRQVVYGTAALIAEGKLERSGKVIHVIAHKLKDLPAPRALQAEGEIFHPYRTVAAWYCWRATDTVLPA